MMTNLKANKKQYVVQVFLFSISGYILFKENLKTSKTKFN